MLYLHTGQPGAGKTLYTLHTVRARAAKENRPVYFHGIEILKPEEFPNWHELDDPAKWFDCPDGSIIVHDEAQSLYRPRGNGAQVPEHVARFETHRHQGLDVYLITQHPMLVDSNIRRLTGEHCHVVRAWGAKFATVHKWQQVKDQCDKSRADSVGEQFLYPKDLFDAYKSATVHTHQPRLPWRVFLVVLMPVLAIALAWWAFAFLQGLGETPVTDSSLVPTNEARSVNSARSGRMVRTSVKQDPVEWGAQFVPRIPGLIHTAPRYDSITEPTRAPIPAACIEWTGQGCRCFSQQGTRLDMSEDLCRGIVARGYFVDFESEPRQDSDRREPGPPAATAPSRTETAAHADAFAAPR